MKLTKYIRSGFFFSLFCLFFTQVNGNEAEDEMETTATVTSLKQAYANHFYVGAALSENVIFMKDCISCCLVPEQFDSITPENLLKWESVHPQLDEFNFNPSDQFVNFGEANDMFMVGHVLVWHQQTPDWVFLDENGELRSAEWLEATLRAHITEVMGRYKGRVDAWDVVNEALEDDGSLRNSYWMQILGERYLKLAFEIAHEIDPEAKLYYNDYNMFQPAKRDGAVRLVKSLLDQGVPVHGIGIQGHWGLDYPTATEVRASIEAFIELGVEVHITELDINVLPSAWEHIGADISADFELQEQLNPYTEGLPETVAAEQAAKYRELFEIFLDYPDYLKRVTFWGVHDGTSWRNNWPMEGRTAYPLLFNREGQPKAAFDAVVELVETTPDQ